MNGVLEWHNGNRLVLGIAKYIWVYLRGLWNGGLGCVGNLTWGMERLDFKSRSERLGLGACVDVRELGGAGYYMGVANLDGRVRVLCMGF